MVPWAWLRGSGSFWSSSRPVGGQPSCSAIKSERKAFITSVGNVSALLVLALLTGWPCFLETYQLLCSSPTAFPSFLLLLQVNLVPLPSFGEG